MFFREGGPCEMCGQDFCVWRSAAVVVYRDAGSYELQMSKVKTVWVMLMENHN
jgi:hypothetical protein